MAALLDGAWSTKGTPRRPGARGRPRRAARCGRPEDGTADRHRGGRGADLPRGELVAGVSGDRRMRMASRTLEATALDHPDVLVLIAEVQAEYERRYGDPAVTGRRCIRSSSAPAGRFFVVRSEGRPVAMGGWRRGGPGGALTTRRSSACMCARRCAEGASRARCCGAWKAAPGPMECGGWSLTTGTAQPEAIGLYTSSGYTTIAPFGYYAASPDGVHLARTLVPDSVR